VKISKYMVQSKLK